MILETIVVAGVAVYAARNFVQVNVKLKPHSIARTIGRAKETVHNAVDEVKRQMVSETEWQESRAKKKAQTMYDQTVAGIFESASDEEKEALLEMFKKYAPSDQ